MVSSELVVLLIVCVGINTGSAEDPGESATNTQSFVPSNAQNLVEMIPIALTTMVMIPTPLNV